MPFNNLLLEIKDGVGTVTLNRPDVYNAFNDEMSYELQDALKEVEKNKEVRVVVLTGAGKAFCSGQDLKAAAAAGNRSFKESLEKRYNPIIRAMRKMPKPIVGRINGVAAGAGCSLALACDVIVATDSVTLIEVFINVGLVPDSGSSFFLPRVVGLARAFEYSSMGTKISAQEALQMGMINRVVKAEDLDSEVKKFTDYYSTAPTKAIGLIKKMLNRSFNSDLESMLEYESYCQEIAGNSFDNKEGVTAFIEKRKPAFKGE